MSERSDRTGLTGRGPMLPTSVRELRGRPRGSQAPRLRLVCFPYAGGGAYLYRRWVDRIPADVDLYAVQLPGREDRIREEPAQCLDEAVDTVADDLRAVLTGPYAIFGHSLGAVMGAEVAIRLETRLGLRPEHLVVSGCRGLPMVHVGRQPIHDLPDDELLEHIRRLNGTPEELLADETVRTFVIRLIRADYALFDSYTYRNRGRVSCPLTVLAGDADPTTPPPTLSAWADVTTDRADVRVLPGDHFFLHSAQAEVLDLLDEVLCR